MTHVRVATDIAKAVSCLSIVVLCREGEVQGYKRVDGPSDEELQKKHEEGRKNSPFSNPSRKSPSPSSACHKQQTCVSACQAMPLVGKLGTSSYLCVRDGFYWAGVTSQLRSINKDSKL